MLLDGIILALRDLNIIDYKILDEVVEKTFSNFPTSASM